MRANCWTGKRSVEVREVPDPTILNRRDAIVIGVYGGFTDKFPMGSFMNRSLTMRAGQCHVHRYMPRLLEHIRNGDIDPSFVITHRMSLDDAPAGYRTFVEKADGCEKVVLTP